MGAVSEAALRRTFVAVPGQAGIPTIAGSLLVKLGYFSLKYRYTSMALNKNLQLEERFI